MLQRMQTILDQSQILDLMTLAKIKGISMSNLLRKYVQDGIEVERVKARVKNAHLSPRQKMLKTVTKIQKLKLAKQPTDASLNHDHYLYGAPRKYGSS